MARGGALCWWVVSVRGPLVEDEAAVVVSGEVVAVVEAAELVEGEPGGWVAGAQGVVVVGVGVVGGCVPVEEEAVLLVAEGGEGGRWLFAAWVGEPSRV